MIRSTAGVLIVVVLGLAGASPVIRASQQAGSAGPGLSDALVNRLPVEWRELAKRFVTPSATQATQLPAGTDEALRIAVARQLVRRAEADQLLTDQVRRDPSTAVRVAITQAIAADTRWLNRPATQPLLESLAVSDPRVEVSLAALEGLRRWRMRQLSLLLDKRIATAAASGDLESTPVLAEEQERWISLERGTMLPAFLREPPDVFSALPADRRVRVVAFGDFGTGSAAQKSVARAIETLHRRQPFDFGITLGDNFYDRGMVSPADPRWRTQWEDLYGPLRIPFYAALGNHDWGFGDSPAAEVLYSRQTTSWRMPAPYYTFTAGPVQFFVLDTQSIALSEKQLRWLDAALGRSTARWKVVYGHHPIYSGGNYTDRADLIAKLLPVLAHRADVYLCGHDHNLQAIRAEQGVHFFVAGGGGANLYTLREYERSIFASRANGFGVIDADSTQLRVALIDAAGQTVYEEAIRK
jgi:hypothetical protein